MEETSWTPERLAQYEGPKIGKHLRRELKEQAALLYEKAMILRLLDPDFEKELDTIGALPFLDRYTELLVQEREERATWYREMFEQRRSGNG